MQFNARRFDVGVHGGIALSQRQVNLFDLWKVMEQAPGNSPAYMFQQFGGNRHLRFHGFIDIGITDGVSNVIGLHGAFDAYFQAQVNGEFIAYQCFLFAYTVIGKEAKVFKKNMEVIMSGVGKSRFQTDDFKGKGTCPPTNLKPSI